MDVQLIVRLADRGTIVKRAHVREAAQIVVNQLSHERHKYLPFVNRITDKK